MTALLRTLVVAFAVSCCAPGYALHTQVEIRDGRWHLNGRVTLPGSASEGLLPNIRMVNSVFEDARPAAQWPAELPADFDPAANTAAFIARIPEYKAHGVLAFTISLQGGYPGYEGAHNSAFEADGTLRPAYLERVRRVIEACDAHGMVVILSCLYQRQHNRPPTHLPRALAGRAAIHDAVRNAVRWVARHGFTNVVLEVANEYAHSGYERWHDGGWLRTPAAQVELIATARAAHPRLLVSTSGMGGGTIPPEIAEASDFILIHFNNTPLDQIPERIARVRQAHPGKAIVCNEDDKIGVAGAEAAARSVAGGASWGYMGKEVNQHAPFRFEGAADDPPVYARLAGLAGLTAAVTIAGEAAVTALLSDPLDGTSFAPGTSVSLQATVTVPPADPVRRVRFLADRKVLGTRTAPPWTVTWENVPEGTHNLHIEVETASGRKIGSPKVDIYVRRPAR
jgi:hypothetical protein